MTRATDENLGELHEMMALFLKERIASGEATGAEINAAIKFLKDNDISAVAAPNSPLGNLVSSMPFDVDSDGSEYPQH